MYYGKIMPVTCANGIGCRTALFVSGCTHHCKECFQPETWDFQYGKPYTQATEKYIIEMLTNLGNIDGLTILGGEPMELPNQEALISLVRKTHEIGKTIWLYSGYTWEELMDSSNKRCHGPYTDEILSMIDILVDGEFHIEEKDISLRFRGSRNQRIINVPESLKKNKIVLSKYNF